MRLFEREAKFIREQGYQSFLIYCRLWHEVAHIYMHSDEEWDCPQAKRAYDRAMNLQALADFIDPLSKNNYYLRYRNERNNCAN